MSTVSAKRVLFLAVGDAESNDSWSGTSRRIVDGLRVAGHAVTTANCELNGLRRLLALATTWDPSRPRWWVRYHLGSTGFRMRSRLAQAAVDAHPDTDLVVQVGATFLPRIARHQRLVVLTDGNIVLSEAAAEIAATDAAFLSRRARARVRLREQRVYDSADLVITLSDRVARSCVEDFGVPAERVRAMYAGPNIDTATGYEPLPVPRDVPPTILFVGRQWERKGGDLLLKVFPRVRARVPDARLVIIGPRSLGAAPVGVEFLGLVDKTTAAGWERLQRAYIEASVFCLPSRFEGFAISVLEAMMFGRPSVTLRFPWMESEMVEDGVTGYVIDGADESGLEQRLVTLLSDREKAESMGHVAAVRVRERYSWPAAIGRLDAALRELHDDQSAAAPSHAR
jgi:glycosyltransferase involved in cell wall biosynthesis